MKFSHSYLWIRDNPAKCFAIFAVGLFFYLFCMQLYFLFFDKIGTVDAVKPLEVVSTVKADKSIAASQTLFGQYLPTSAHEIKPSSLDLKVVGVLYSTNPKESQALIQAGGEELPYRVGDTLLGGVVIKRISRQGVIVLHDGAFEGLMLPKDELKFEAMP